MGDVRGEEGKGARRSGLGFSLSLRSAGGGRSDEARGWMINPRSPCSEVSQRPVFGFLGLLDHREIL